MPPDDRAERQRAEHEFEARTGGDESKRQCGAGEQLEHVRDERRATGPPAAFHAEACDARDDERIARDREPYALAAARREYRDCRDVDQRHQHADQQADGRDGRQRRRAGSPRRARYTC